ncbi:T9SS type A sorting domain-containing protein [bacterium]|nr:T9SS type A sorting domain-containing protein [bacterium]MBU1636968.1 T9SS type A sorting domain-containing protein [bacterium]
MAVSVYPNPFNSVTSLSLNLPTGGELNIILYDLLGREVERLHFDNLLAGQQLIRLYMSRYASGVYFAQLQCAEHTITQKLLLLK